jgi:hypothetical protein
MLLARGFEDVGVRLGVRHRNGALESHAWVECGGVLIGDRPEHVRSFTVLDALAVRGSQRRW